MGCGGEPSVFRPVEVDLQGLSPRADVLVVAWFDGDGVDCLALQTTDVRDLAPDAESTWQSGEEPRRLQLPESPGLEGTFVAYTQANGEVLQLGCRQVRFDELETPEISLLLSEAE